MVCIFGLHMFGLSMVSEYLEVTKSTRITKFGDFGNPIVRYPLQNKDRFLQCISRFAIGVHLQDFLLVDFEKKAGDIAI